MKLEIFCNRIAQQTIEFMLLVTGIIVIIVVVITQNGLFQKNVEDGLEQAIVGIECMAETACFNSTLGCVSICGNGCCEPGETVGGCTEDC